MFVGYKASKLLLHSPHLVELSYQCCFIAGLVLLLVYKSGMCFAVWLWEAAIGSHQEI